MSALIEDLSHIKDWDDSVTSGEKRQVFILLKTIRDSGNANMLATAPYLQEHFNLTRVVARKAVLDWYQGRDSA